MPLNEKVIGKKYSSGPVTINRHESIYYALSYNEDNDAYFDNRREGGIIVPPMFAVNYAVGPTAEIMFDEEVGLNMMMVVHYSQEFEWLKPVKPDDVIKTEGIITHIHVREKGAILGWETSSFNQHDEKVLISRWEFYDRSAGSGQPTEHIDNPVERGELIWKDSMKVRNGQSFIYAEPSGDHNPIHVDDEFARKVGLPGIILQGLCTMAFTHKAAVDNLCGKERDPMRLRNLHVRFARPVLPGQTISFEGFKMKKGDEGETFGITARNDEDKEVLKNGWCLVVDGDR